MRKYRYKSIARTEVQATLFGCFLLLAASVFLASAFFSAGPIVLGTEMNTNGMVEYLCIGQGCENFTDFHWFDK